MESCHIIDGSLCRDALKNRMMRYENIATSEALHRYNSFPSAVGAHEQLERGCVYYSKNETPPKDEAGLDSQCRSNHMSLIILV